MRVMPDLPPMEMRQRLGRARRCEERRGFEVAAYLRCIEERRYFTLYGFSSVAAFATAELGMSTRQVRERIRVARALDDLPRLREALRRGKLCFSAVREITRVATAASEASWIRAAARHSVHELERLVASAGKDGTVPPRPTLGLQRNLVKIHLKLLPEEAAKLEVVAARRAAGTGRPADVRETLLAGLQVLYETEPTVDGTRNKTGSSSGNGVANGNGVSRSTTRPTRVAVRNRPELVYVMCRQCREGAVATEEGFVATTPEHLAEVEKTARVHDATRAAEPGAGEDVVSTLDVAEVPPETRDVPTPESMRRLVLARDGQRCTVPGCAERAELFAHHITWRRHGGRTHPDKLITVCAVHHGCIHNGTLLVRGRVSSGVEYLDPDGTPHVGRGPDPELEEILTAHPVNTEPGPSIHGDPATTHFGSPGIVSQDARGSRGAREVGGSGGRPGGDSRGSWDRPGGDEGRGSLEPCFLGDLCEVPREIDVSFWRRFSGCFGWRSGRRGLVFTPGVGDLTGMGGAQDEEKWAAGADVPRFGDLSGHRQAIEVLSSTVEMVRRGGGVAPAAVLLTGRAGLGKTTLARALARELEVPFHGAHGTFLDDPTQLLGLLAQLGAGDVLFLDEAHSVPRQVLEVLYTAVEGRHVDLLVSQGSVSRSVRLRLEPFMLVAATTREGRLPAPLLSRFERRVELEPLERDDMARLLDREARDAGRELHPAVRHLLVNASLGVPRTALAVVRTALGLARLRGATVVGFEEFIPAMRQHDLDGYGRCRVQRRIVEVLKRHGGPMGLDHLATHVGKSSEEVRELYEPDLVRTGWVLRTPRGRVLAPGVAEAA